MTLKLVPRQVARGFACLAKSDVLYHATSLANALSILREDRLRLVSVNAVEERQLGRADVFWVSMARTKTSSYLVSMLGQAGSKGVVFEANGRKLGQVLKSVPIDYWRGAATKDNRGHEQEERLLGRKPSLAGFSRFLVAVHVIGKVEDAVLAQLARLCTVRGVPCLAYPSYQAWLARKGSEVAASEGGETADANDDEGSEAGGGEVNAERRQKNLAAVRKLLAGWQEDSQETARPWDLPARDLAAYLDPKAVGRYDPQLAQEVVNFMRRHRLKTTQQLVGFLENKWAAKEVLVSRRRVAATALDLWQSLHDATWLQEQLGKAGDAWERWCDVWQDGLLEGDAAAGKLGMPVPWASRNELWAFAYDLKRFPQEQQAKAAEAKLAPLLAELRQAATEALARLEEQPEVQAVTEAWLQVLPPFVAAARELGATADLDNLYERVLEVARAVRGEYHAAMSWPLYRRGVLAALDEALD